VLEHGARALSAMRAECGSLRRGLGAYASGRCSGGSTAAGRVLEEREQLRRLGDAPRRASR
jgi:hypothetical protein